MITEDYIDFNLAKELKKFDIDREVIWNHYYTETGELKTCSLDFKIPEDYYCSCPSLSIIQKWLREKKNINIMIGNYDGRIAGYDIKSLKEGISVTAFIGYPVGNDPWLT